MEILSQDVDGIHLAQDRVQCAESSKGGSDWIKGGMGRVWVREKVFLVSV
jgi:hypothetical protein